MPLRGADRDGSHGRRRARRVAPPRGACRPFRRDVPTRPPATCARRRTSARSRPALDDAAAAYHGLPPGLWHAGVVPRVRRLVVDARHRRPRRHPHRGRRGGLGAGGAGGGGVLHGDVGADRPRRAGPGTGLGPRRAGPPDRRRSRAPGRAGDGDRQLRAGAGLCQHRRSRIGPRVVAACPHPAGAAEGPLRVGQRAGPGGAGPCQPASRRPRWCRDGAGGGPGLPGAPARRGAGDLPGRRGQRARGSDEAPGAGRLLVAHDGRAAGAALPADQPHAGRDRFPALRLPLHGQDPLPGDLPQARRHLPGRGGRHGTTPRAPHRRSRRTTDRSSPGGRGAGPAAGAPGWPSRRRGARRRWTGARPAPPTSGRRGPCPSAAPT